ncbi:hypothetical protein SAMN05192533_10878 [Mesobacillus persicus]|uniref:Uncharacterized protein n=1 Tax=Mesobacillus persicus TaxID=930146 RepID=A0A1H8D4X4_9BACI|nr:hypothetical protein [Mesobacillus persicus]SEN02266.1 hypothetical protein SAMN05192533_10878 [Mesobacillus persicus]
MKNQDRLSDEEIKVILRAADEILGQGGRTLLTRVTREKTVTVGIR